MKFDRMSISPMSDGRSKLLMQFCKFRFASIILEKDEPIEDVINKICDLMNQATEHHVFDLESKLEKLNAKKEHDNNSTGTETKESS